MPGADGRAAPAPARAAATGTVFDQLASNPDLGTPAPVREPGDFGPFDPASEGHIFLGPLDKGITEGVAKSWGIRHMNEGLSGALGDVWDNLVQGAKDTFQKIADYKRTPGTHTAMDTEGILSGRVPAALALTPLSMMASGIEGMTGALEQGVHEVRNGFASGDRQQVGRGAGLILGSLGQVAMGMEGSEAGEKAGVKAGEVMEARAPRAGNSILRATDPRNYLYGKNPGRALIDEPIRMTNSIENLRDQLSQAGDRLHDAVDTQLKKAGAAKKAVDVPAALDPIFRDALDDVSKQAGLRNRAGVVSAIKILEDDVLNEHDAQGNVTRARADMSPVEVNELKRSVGKSTKWDVLPGSVDPEIQAYVNELRKRVYGKLNDLVEQAAPGTKPLNARYANVIEASRLIARRLAREESADLGMRRLLSRGEWLGALTAYMHGEPVTGTALALHNLARSTAGRIARARAGTALGRALQRPGSVPRVAAGAAGASAGVAPAASGAAERQDELARRALGGE